MRDSHPILILEQDGQTALQLHDAFEQQDAFNPIKVVRHADEVRYYLRGIGVYENRRQHPFPSILILDFDSLNGSAVELLNWLRGTQFLDQVVLLGIGSVMSHQKLEQAYNLNLNGFFRKTNNLKLLADTIAGLRWVEHLSEPERSLVQQKLPCHQRASSGSSRKPVHSMDQFDHAHLLGRIFVPPKPKDQPSRSEEAVSD